MKAFWNKFQKNKIVLFTGIAAQSIIFLSAAIYFSKHFYYPYFFSWFTLLGLITILLASAALMLKSKFWKAIKPVKPIATLITLSLMVLAGLFFRSNLPLNHYIFHDEESYIAQARLIDSNFTTGDCETGTFTNGQLDCPNNVPGVPKKKEGYPLLLAGIFKFSNPHGSLGAFIFNITLSLLTIILGFFIGSELVSPNAGLAISLFLALFPDNIRWSVTSSLEIPSLFFFFLGFFMFTIFLRTKDYKLYTAAILLWVYASFIRPELVVILPFALLAIFLNKNDTTIIFKNEKNIALSLLAAFFILFDFFISYISNKFYYSNFIAFYNIPGLYSIKFFITNLKNIIFYTQYSKNYIYILSPIIIAFGFWMLVKKHLPAALVVIGTVLGIFAIHTSYYFGSYAIMGDLHSRFPMMWFSISAIFFGVGLNWIIQKLKYPLGIYILLLIIGSVCLWKFSGTTFFPSPATQPLSESKALDNFQLLNPTCLYISPLGFRDISNGYDAMDIQDFISQEYAAQVNQRSCVIFFDSYMCNWQNPDDACRLLITNFASEQILTQPRAWQLLTPNMKLAKTNFNPINPAPTLQQLIFYPHKNNPNDIR